MPHIIVEYSRELENEARDVLKAAHHVVTESGLFSAQAVKGRSIGFDDVVLPDGAQNFMHITVSILSGRNTQERSTLSQQVFESAKQHAPNVDRLSVNIHEMDKDTYSK